MFSPCGQESLIKVPKWCLTPHGNQKALNQRQLRTSQRTRHEQARGPVTEKEIRKEMMSLFSFSVKVLIPTFPLLNVSLFHFSAVGKQHFTIYFKIGSQHTIHQNFIFSQRKILKRIKSGAFLEISLGKLTFKFLDISYILLNKGLISEIMGTETKKMCHGHSSHKYVSKLMGKTFHCLLKAKFPTQN